MSFIFFILALYGAWMTLNLYIPMYSTYKVVFLSFIFGFLIGETALFVIALQVLIFLIFVLAGYVHGIWGILGTAITALSWLAMLYHYTTSFYAKSSMENALTDALGQDYRSNTDTARSRMYCSDRLDFKALLMPWCINRKDVERIKNITYDIVDDEILKLDIYRHISKPQNCPVLLQIHGGGWTYGTGSKNEQARPLMNHMAARGWIVVSIEYRLSPYATFPEHIIDCKKALAWIKKNIKKWGGNPDFVVLTGGSAGGHLCSLFALSANDPAFQPGFEKVDTNVQGCVPYYGVYDFCDTHGFHTSPNLYRLISYAVMKKRKTADIKAFHRASPMHRIHKNAPPFLIIHGGSDTLASVAEAQKFAEMLKHKSKNPVGYALIQGAQHAFDIIPSVRSEYVKLGVERFANCIYDNWLKKQAVKHKRRVKPR